MRFVFVKSELLTYEEADKQDGCVLKTKVAQAKSRFDNFGFSLAEIDKTLCELLNVPISAIELVLMDEDDFYLNEFPEPEDDDTNHDNWEKLAEVKYDIDNKKESTNLGLLIPLRMIRKALDSSKNEDIVALFYEALPEDNNIDSLGLFPDNRSPTVTMEKKYLQSAKANISTEAFDLAYIEMIIALESSIKGYIARKSENELIFELKGLSLMDLIKYGISFLGKQKIDDSSFKLLNEAYNIRNSIIHNRARRFKVSDVSKSLMVVEKFIRLIDSLP